MQKDEITICSVYYSSKTARQLEKNYEMTRALNPGTNIMWLVGDNSPREHPERIRQGIFSVVDGARDGEASASRARGSLQHALALKKLFPLVKTRFLLILDPDFYAVRKNWIVDVIEYMKASRLAFFGSVWHPRYYAKYRYFPTVHCFFVDLEKVPIAEIDFAPMPEDSPKTKKGIIAMRTPRILKRFILILTFQNRKFIGDSRDTGYGMYKRFFGKKDIRYECLQPVFCPWRDRDWFARVLYIPNLMIEFFLPDRLCFTPQKRGYYSRVSFHERGFPDVAGQGWEEYLWQDKPFGVHVRGTKYRGGNNGIALEVDRILDRFLNNRSEFDTQ